MRTPAVTATIIEHRDQEPNNSDRFFFDPAHRGSSPSQTTRGSGSPDPPCRNTAPVQAGATQQPAFQAEIRERAYQIYQRRDAWSGDAVGDWLQAERELAAERRGPGPARGQMPKRAANKETSNP
jgi:hypothetical protein